MKILDRYVAKNFLIGYFVAFCVLMGLRIMIDLFVNLDEFTEHANLSTFEAVKIILSYYGLNATLYFRDFAGMITVVAAAFSLGKLVRNNELVAVMASGVSLKRVITPIIVLAILLTGVLVIDQEMIIPPLSDKLVRSHDDLPGQETYDMWFVGDENGSLLCSQKFDVQTQTLYNPTIILRAKDPNTSGLWMVTGRIDANKAIYNPKTGNWNLTGGLYAENSTDSAPRKVDTYITDLKPRDIPVRIQSQNKTLMSWQQLRKLALQGTKVKDQAKLQAQMQAHVTDPAINLVMLMISLPLLVVRDPKMMKSAVLISFLLTGACMITNFACKLLATEEVFGHIIPQFWTWLPVLIFLPIAILEFDSMKT